MFEIDFPYLQKENNLTVLIFITYGVNFINASQWQYVTEKRIFYIITA